MAYRVQRHHPLKWPAVITVTFVCLFAGIFLLPAHWINQFFSPLKSSITPGEELPSGWLEILPPPSIEIIPESLKPPKEPDPTEQKEPPVEDPAWWTAAWQIKTTAGKTIIQETSFQDSVSVLLDIMGVGMDFTRKALPDSLMDHRLMMLRIEDGFGFEELKPYISALGRARARADKHSREAAMYDEHLGSTIMVPD